MSRLYVFLCTQMYNHNVLYFHNATLPSILHPSQNKITTDAPQQNAFKDTKVEGKTEEVYSFTS